MAEKILGAVIVTISIAGAGVGIGLVFNGFLTALAKNPNSENKLFVWFKKIIEYISVTCQDNYKVFKLNATRRQILKAWVIWANVFILCLVASLFVIFILVFNINDLIEQRVDFCWDIDHQVWFERTKMITYYPILLGSITLLICGFIILFFFLFLSFQLSCYISLIGFFGMLVYFYLFAFLLILPKSKELFLYTIIQLIVITLMFLFTSSVSVSRTKVCFELSFINISYSSYIGLFFLGTVLPVWRKVLLKCYKKLLLFNADGPKSSTANKTGSVSMDSTGTQVYSFEAVPPTPLNKAILDCLQVERRALTPSEIIHVSKGISEFNTVHDLLFPCITNDGLFVAWYTGATFYRVPFWGPSWETIKELTKFFMSYERATRVVEIARMRCEHYSKEFYQLYYSDRLPETFAALQYQSWMDECPPIIHPVAKLAILFGSAVTVYCSIKLIIWWLRENDFLPPAEPDSASSSADASTTNVASGTTFVQTQEAREYAERESRRLYDRKLDDDIIRLDGANLNLPDNISNDNIRQTGRPASRPIDESLFSEEQRRLISEARRSADIARRSIEKIRREASARISLINRGETSLTDANIAKEEQRLTVEGGRPTVQFSIPALDEDATLENERATRAIDAHLSAGEIDIEHVRRELQPPLAPDSEESSRMTNSSDEVTIEPASMEEEEAKLQRLIDRNEARDASDNARFSTQSHSATLPSVQVDIPPVQQANNSPVSISATLPSVQVDISPAQQANNSPVSISDSQIRPRQPKVSQYVWKNGRLHKWVEKK